MSLWTSYETDEIVEFIESELKVTLTDEQKRTIDGHVENARSDGYDDGHSDGYSEGEGYGDDRYQEGYDEGYEAALDEFDIAV